MRLLKISLLLLLALTLAACDNIPFLTGAPPRPPEQIISAALGIHSRKDTRLLTGGGFTNRDEAFVDFRDPTDRCGTFKLPDEEPVEITTRLDFTTAVNDWINKNRHQLPYRLAGIKDIHWYWYLDETSNTYLPISRITYVPNTTALFITLPGLTTGECTARLTDAYGTEDVTDYFAWRQEGGAWTATASGRNNSTYILPKHAPYDEANRNITTPH